MSTKKKTNTPNKKKEVSKSFKEQEPTTYFPSDFEKELISKVFNKFRNAADDRNRNFEYFDGSNLIEYINDSVRRFTTNVDEREGIEDWQARVHDPFTRNKTLAILGKVMQLLPIAEFTGRGDEDGRKADIANSLYEYSEDLDDYEELMMFILLEAIVKGTAIGYEGLNINSRDIRNVKKTGDEITFTKDTSTTNKLFGAIIPIEEFYPQSVSIRNIKQMDECFWVSEMPLAKFQSQFGHYSLSADVQPQQVWGANDARPFYADVISTNIGVGNVELIRYYNKQTDEYILIANGVWINPLFDNEGNKVVAPLPFNHKELPFWDIKFDFFGPAFFYGKSLPDRLKSMQDVLNVLNNMMLDQSFLSIFKPMLTTGFDTIEDDYLRPGRRTSVDTQGQPLSQSFMMLDLGTPNGWHQYILEYTKKVMEESSLDQLASGQAGVGGRTTAEEIRTAAGGVSSLLGLFGRFINYGIKRKATLRLANILQFWTDPSSPMISKVMSEDGNEKVNKAFNIFKISGTKITGGKRGTKIIEMYESRDKRPSKETLKTRAQLAELDTKSPVEIIAIDPSYIREFQYDVKVVMNQKKETTKDLDKAMHLESVKVLMSFFPQMINMKELAAQTIEKLGLDPEKILTEEILNPQPAEQPQGQGMGVSTKPEMNLGNNAVRQAMGGENGSMQLRDLANGMTG